MEEVIELTVNELLELILQSLEDDGLEDFAASISDGVLGNNDLERIFMYSPELQYNEITGKYENVTVFQELSARLSLLDSRIDTTNQLISTGFSFVCTGLICAFTVKLFSWFYNVLGV